MAFSFLLVVLVLMVGGGGKRTKRMARKSTEFGESSSTPTAETYIPYCDEALVGSGNNSLIGSLGTFRCDETHYLHRDKFNHCTVIGERCITVEDFPNSLIARQVDGRKWSGVVFYLEIPNVSMVKEFYANLDVSFAKSKCIHCFIRGKFFRITPKSISEFVNAPIVRNNAFPYKSANVPSLDRVASLLTGVERNWNGIASTLKHSDLTPEFSALHVFVSANICPVLRTTDVNKEKALMMYAIATNEAIDLGGYIFRYIVHAYENATKKSSLPFGSLITSLCKYAGGLAKPNDQLGVLGATYNATSFHKRLSSLNRARPANPNPGANFGENPEVNIPEQPMPPQEDNRYSMEGLWNMMSGMNDNVLSLRNLVIENHRSTTERLDAIDDRIAFYHNNMGQWPQDENIVNDDDDMDDDAEESDGGNGSD